MGGNNGLKSGEDLNAELVDGRPEVWWVEVGVAARWTSAGAGETQEPHNTESKFMRTTSGSPFT